MNIVSDFIAIFLRKKIPDTRQCFNAIYPYHSSM